VPAGYLNNQQRVTCDDGNEKIKDALKTVKQKILVKIKSNKMKVRGPFAEDL